MIARADQLTTAVIIILLIFYLVVANGYERGAQVVPLILGGTALVIALIQFAGRWLAPLRPLVGTLDTGEDAKVLTDRAMRHRFIAIGGSLLLIPVSVSLIGLPLTLPLYVLVFMVLCRQRIVATAIATAAIGAASYGLLVTLIAMPWDEGYIWGVL